MDTTTKRESEQIVAEILAQERQTRRLVIVFGSMIFGLFCLVAAAGIADSAQLIIWNESASLPKGFYVRKSAGPLRPGDLVLFWLPGSERLLADKRGYIPYSVPLLKPVAAIAGDVVCEQEDNITINGTFIVTRRLTDPSHRPLSTWFGCETLAADQIFVLSTYAPDSYDGRYFGPVRTSSVIQKVAPLWTF